ncbi:mitochondrial GAL4 domain-containing protein [Andalucia godoyi]|uniref:Mitochondrial GAL4 domain-containing protein n=1 Tax=Andalucia godoyi TaxID=505711 RepID=A0A8K0F4H8_ANDGO|nr:mitochondrial GAL4 domain-containing protein [Andalucia godoyi]|eukprot:ANDGO_05150.mRNA.1 mitochondrial GAL4 domain-containing protein
MRVKRNGALGTYWRNPGVFSFVFCDCKNVGITTDRAVRGGGRAGQDTTQMLAGENDTMDEGADEGACAVVLVRATKACVCCREIKRSCDGKSPCSRCVSRSIAHMCSYVPRRRKTARLTDAFTAVHWSGPGKQRPAVLGTSRRDRATVDTALSLSFSPAVSPALSHSVSASSPPLISTTPILNAAAPSTVANASDVTSAGASGSASAGGGAAVLPETTAFVIAQLLNLKNDSQFLASPFYRFLVRHVQSMQSSVLQMVISYQQVLHDLLMDDSSAMPPPTSPGGDIRDVETLCDADVVASHKLSMAKLTVENLPFPAMLVTRSGFLYRFNGPLSELLPFPRTQLESSPFDVIDMFAATENTDLMAKNIQALMKARESPLVQTVSLRCYLRRKDNLPVEYTCGVSFVRHTNSGRVLFVMLQFIPIPS